MKVAITFGAMSPRVSEQLKAQGLTMQREYAAQLQRDAEAITRLYVRAVLTDAETSRARKRLMKQISKHAKKMEPPQ